ncbi:MAG: XRE family transcriptional regulator [Kiritimatiellae bacterium]|nr:XRE family transcriptional regulator [Kiritimatiellia bacterium]
MTHNYIGIDGGGTKTEAVWFDETGRVRGRVLAGACNTNVLGLEASAAHIGRCVDALTGGPVDGLYVGTAGIFTADDGPMLERVLSKRFAGTRIRCENDVMNVIASATDADRCVAGVCGTGMIVYAKEPDRVIRLDGWGYLLGLGGSGYDIGRDVIRAAVGESEGTSAATTLTPLVEQKAGMTLERLVLEVYRHEPAFVASFAPLAFEADAVGDAVARDILVKNARAFAQVLNHAASVFDCGDTVVVSGGIATNAIFGERLKQVLRPDLKLIVPSYPQVLGACFNGARLCGIDSPTLRETLIAGYAAAQEENHA